jgi:hypothetical protein
MEILANPSTKFKIIYVIRILCLRATKLYHNSRMKRICLLSNGSWLQNLLKTPFLDRSKSAHMQNAWTLAQSALCHKFLDI